MACTSQSGVRQFGDFSPTSNHHAPLVRFGHSDVHIVPRRYFHSANSRNMIYKPLYIYIYTYNNSQPAPIGHETNPNCISVTTNELSQGFMFFFCHTPSEEQGSVRKIFHMLKADRDFGRRAMAAYAMKTSYGIVQMGSV